MGIIKNIRGPILQRIKVLPLKSFEQAEIPDEEEALDATALPEIESQETQEQTQPPRVTDKQNTPSPKTLTDEELAEYKAKKLLEIDQEISTYHKEQLGNIDEEKQNKLAAGYKEGQEAATREAHEKLLKFSSELKSTLAQLATANQDIAEKAKADITTLAIRAAERIINKQLTLEPAIIQAIVDDALSKVTEKGRVIIRVNPEDSVWLKDHEDWLDKYSQDIKELIIQEDNKVEQGGCIIETKLGYIDSSICSKIEAISAVFKATYEEENRSTPQHIEAPSA